jgi:hypothetical protein
MFSTTAVPMSQFGGMLIGGAINGTVLALLAISAPRLTRRILFFVLVFAAAMYVVFTHAQATPLWLMIELIGIVIYGSMGYRGLKGSGWWLVAGWLAHPIWDGVIHLLGSGRAFAPVTYTVPCLTYDLAVAAVLAVQIGRDRLRTA